MINYFLKALNNTKENVQYLQHNMKRTKKRKESQVIKKKKRKLKLKQEIEN